MRSGGGDHNKIGFPGSKLQPARIGVAALYLKLCVARQCMPHRSGIFALLHANGNVFNRFVSERNAESNHHQNRETVYPEHYLRLPKKFAKPGKNQLAQGRVSLCTHNAFVPPSRRCRPVNVTKTSSRLA